MSAAEHFSVEVKPDFVDKQTRARPIPALAELIWNALDADATRVFVEFEYGDLAGGMSKITVRDNGVGFPREKASGLFTSLGGSWKRMTRVTDDGRQIHGQEGKGRYKAFALGRSVTWHVVDQVGEKAKSFDVSLFADNLTDVAITPEQFTPDDRGVTVVIGDLHHNFQTLDSDEGLQDLAEIFALYLANYPKVQIEVSGRRVDPASAMIGEPVTKDLGSIRGASGPPVPASVQIIEWKSPTKRTLYLCSADGFPLETAETRFHIQGFAFSAYLRSTYIENLQKAGLLGLAELDPELEGAVDRALETIKAHFRERAAEEARSVVDEWKDEKVYPFEGEAKNPVEVAERQVFEIVAAQVQRLAPEIGGGSKKGKALHLRMLRNALERGPEELQLILREVLDLPLRTYASAVRKDDRFNRVKKVRWHFIVISNDYDESTDDLIRSVDPEKRLILRDGNYTIQVMTWGEVIQENRARLLFFQQRLEHSVSEGEALRYLHEKHAALLKGVVDESDFDRGADTEVQASA